MRIEDIIETSDYGSVTKNRDGSYTVIVSVDGQMFEVEGSNLERAGKALSNAIARHVEERESGLARLRKIADGRKHPRHSDRSPTALDRGYASPPSLPSPPAEVIDAEFVDE